MLFCNYDNTKKAKSTPKTTFKLSKTTQKRSLQNVGREKFNIQKLATT